MEACREFMLCPFAVVAYVMLCAQNVPDITQEGSVLRNAKVQFAENYKGSLHLIKDFEPAPILDSLWS